MRLVCSTFAASLLIIAASGGARAQSAPVPDSTLRFLSALAGRWNPANTADGPRNRPPLDFVVHSYQWTVGAKAMRLREGYRPDAETSAQLDGLVYWNPAREQVEFVAIAGAGPQQGRHFFGVYRRLADGSVERIYDVTYRSAEDTPGEELGGRVRRFREVYTSITADSVSASLEWWRDGRWQPFGPGRYTIVRRNGG